MKRFDNVITVAIGILTLLVLGMLLVRGFQDSRYTDGCVPLKLEEHCYDEEQFQGNLYATTMYVASVDYEKGLYNEVTLIDVDNNVWVYNDIDIYEDEEVCVIICDNGTRTKEDDKIVKFFYGIE